MTDFTPFLNFGLAGVMLAWFALRLENRLKDQSAALDRMTRALLLDLTSRERLNDNSNAVAKSILAEIEEAERIRGRGGAE